MIDALPLQRFKRYRDTVQIFPFTYKNDTYISLKPIEKGYKTLDCGVDDILEFVSDSAEATEGINR
jgi:DNA-binding Xre family transcriptional regulator